MDLIPGLPDDLGLECLVRVPHQYFSSVSSVCRSWKRRIELPEFWRHRKASGLTRKVIVMAQARVDPNRGLGAKKHAPVYRLTICEPETGYWAELPPIPGGLPIFCQLVGVGLNLVVLGGWNPVTWEVSNGVFIYNFISATWHRGADIPGSKRSFFACASDSDRTVFVAGGHDEEKCALKSALAYDVAEDKWMTMPDMARERDESKGVFNRGKFHVISGYSTNAQGQFETSAESFDIATWEWAPVQEDFLNNPMCPRNCVDDGNGKLLMCNDSHVIVGQGSTWEAVAELPNNIRNMGLMTAWEGKVVIIGSERFGAAHEMLVLDLKSSKWKKVEVEEDFTGHVQYGCCLEL
ncbi:F-box/kelch-repeat protein At1g80440-like [Sesamum indicum]|uniref:F-box/kelch-repeat protein At1g80440-like n=1 Tax=Sesamum indicum TaxID=4182 RepID=A0A6I9SQC2_SESIN|nr:F-box/kelch-repeat protein At1g80440-like [Sesamum indicum]